MNVSQREAVSADAYEAHIQRDVMVPMRDGVLLATTTWGIKVGLSELPSSENMSEWARLPAYCPAGVEASMDSWLRVSPTNGQ